MAHTQVVVRGPDPPGFFSPSQPPQKKWPVWPFQDLFRF